MKAVQTFLLLILLIAVGPYPQVVSATGTEPTETQTDTIKLEGLTTVAPNEETKGEDEVTDTPQKLQNSVLILQLSIESNITVNSSPNESIVDIPESIPTFVADLPHPSTASSLESVSTASELKSTTAKTEATQNVVEPKNTTGSLETSSTSESSSKMPVPTVPSSFPESGLETASGFHEIISESPDVAQTHLDSENTPSLRSESSYTSESSLPTVPSSAESRPASTEETPMPPNSENNSSISPESSSAPEGVLELTTDQILDLSTAASSQTAQAPSESENNLSESNADNEMSPQSSLSTATSSAESITASSSTQLSEGSVTSVLDLSEADAAPVSSSITETDGAAKTEASDVVMVSNADAPVAVEKTETPAGLAPSLSTDQNKSEPIPASTEAIHTPSHTDNTSSTPSQSTSASESAPEPSLPSAIPEITSEASPPLPCSETGNFPNPANCLTYISCTGNLTDLLRQELVCPDRTAFSPVFRRCTRDVSPCNDGPSCLYPGSIADPTNNSSYYWCVPSLLGGFHKYHIQCSVDETFNALFGRCLLNTPTFGLINPSLGIPNDRDIAKAESKQMKKELKAKAKEEKNRLKMAAKAKADADKLALKQQKKQKDDLESDD